MDCSNRFKYTLKKLTKYLPGQQGPHAKLFIQTKQFAEKFIFDHSHLHCRKKIVLLIIFDYLLRVLATHHCFIVNCL